jgi:hypothetical protein
VSTECDDGSLYKQSTQLRSQKQPPSSFLRILPTYRIGKIPQGLYRGFSLLFSVTVAPTKGNLQICMFRFWLRSGSGYHTVIEITCYQAHAWLRFDYSTSIVLLSWRGVAWQIRKWGLNPIATQRAPLPKDVGPCMFSTISLCDGIIKSRVVLL